MLGVEGVTDGVVAGQVFSMLVCPEFVSNDVWSECKDVGKTYEFETRTSSNIHSAVGGDTTERTHINSRNGCT